MKYKTSCEGCLFKVELEVLPGMALPRCQLAGHVVDGVGASICPLNRLLAEIDKAMNGGTTNEH